MSCQLTPNILNRLNFKPQGSYTFPKQVYEDTVNTVWNERDLLVGSVRERIKMSTYDVNERAYQRKYRHINVK